MSVMLATDPIVVDTVVNKVVQEGDSVHRTGTSEALEVFQGFVEGNPYLAVINGQERTMAEYGLALSVMCVCTCVFTYAYGQANHYQDRDVCTLEPESHY